MTNPYNQPYPPVPPVPQDSPRRGFSGFVVSVIAVIALAAGCVGGVAVGAMGNTPEAAPAPTVTKTVVGGAKRSAAAPEDTNLPEAANDTSKHVVLPDFKGQNAAIAKQWLVDQGWDEFKNIKLGSQDTYDTFVLLPENWTVVKQSHRAGTKVLVGTTIVLTCTKQ